MHWFSRIPPGTVLCDRLARGGTPGIALLIAPKIINTEFIYKTNMCEDLKRRNNDCTKASGVSVGPGKSPGPLGLVGWVPARGLSG